jgi:uncharacterized membrane-anchored protein YitT (DUF2179 family)
MPFSNIPLASPVNPSSKPKGIVMIVVGSILVAVGILALLIKLDILSGSLWSYTWPAILIILGLSFILGRFYQRGWRGWCFPRRNKDKQ